MTNRDDDALLRSYCVGSEDAFRELARRYGAIVYAACLKYLRRPEPAEDAAQAVFLVLARKAGQVRVRTTLIPWLLTTSRVVCRNLARDERRKRRYEQPLEEETAAAESATDNSIFEALDKLRDPDREAIVLRFVQGLSLDEVGKLQGISEDAARMRVKRGIAKLKKNFVPSVLVTPSLLNRLASPKTAPALIQQLALKSSTMAISSSTAIVTIVGVAGVGVASLHRINHSSIPAAASTLTPPAVRKLPPPTPSFGDDYQIPGLHSPFTLTYRVVSKEQPEGKHFVTISSEGTDLLVQEGDASTGETKTSSFILNQDGRTYTVFHSNTPGVLSNMWVTSSIVVAPSFPFIGADLPTLHPFVEPTGSGKREGSGWRQAANIYMRGLPPEHVSVEGDCLVADLGNRIRAVGSVVVGSEAKAYEVWKLSNFHQWNGVTIASTIVDSTYNQSSADRPGTAHDWTKYYLETEQSIALPAEQFRPEYYLGDGDNVEYKIPKQANMNLDFIYHQNGTTIEEQAGAQDRLEMKIHQEGR